MENKHPTRKFKGPDGMPSFETIHCLEVTVESWEVLKERLNIFSLNSERMTPVDDLYTPSVQSESTVEHSFGFTSKRGQGNSQDQQEYCTSKRLASVDFILRICKMPFNQKIKEKLRDKGYQDLIGNRVQIPSKDLKEIFSYNMMEEETGEIADDDHNLLKKANLISRSVPRQTSRAKWREKSSYGPNMFISESDAGVLCKNDIVCTRSLTNQLLYLIVQEDTPLVYPPPQIHRPFNSSAPNI